VTRKESGEKVCGVLADLYIAPESHSAPTGDLGKWVMEAAENSPDQFGQSIVFTYADMKSTNAAGEPVMRSEFDSDAAWYDAIGENKVFAVLGKLHGSDFTDTPAATDGVFSQDSLASEAEDMLAEHPEILAAIEANPDKVIEFLDREGLLSVLETKRVAGLQAAKDKTIAELREMNEKFLADYNKVDEALKAAETKTAELSAEIEKLNADITGKVAEIENLKSDIDAKSKALDAAAGNIKQLETKNADAEKALAESQAALAAEIERYRAQVGAAMAPAGEVQSTKSFREQLAALPSKDRAAFYQAHKAEIDNNK